MSEYVCVKLVIRLCICDCFGGFDLLCICMYVCMYVCELSTASSWLGSLGSESNFACIHSFLLLLNISMPDMHV